MESPTEVVMESCVEYRFRAYKVVKEFESVPSCICDLSGVRNIVLSFSLFTARPQESKYDCMWGFLVEVATAHLL